MMVIFTYEVVGRLTSLFAELCGGTLAWVCPQLDKSTAACESGWFCLSRLTDATPLKQTQTHLHIMYLKASKIITSIFHLSRIVNREICQTSNIRFHLQFEWASFSRRFITYLFLWPSTSIHSSLSLLCVFLGDGVSFLPPFLGSIGWSSIEKLPPLSDLSSPIEFYERSSSGEAGSALPIRLLCLYMESHDSTMGTSANVSFKP